MKAARMWRKTVNTYSRLKKTRNFLVTLNWSNFHLETGSLIRPTFAFLKLRSMVDSNCQKHFNVLSVFDIQTMEPEVQST